MSGVWLLLNSGDVLVRSIALALLALAPAAPQAAAQEGVEPRQVQIGILLADLSEVDGAAQAFSADIFVIATWIDPALAGADDVRTIELEDVWHPSLVIFNARDVSSSMPDEVVVLPDGTVTYLKRYTGDFSSQMNLREFPRDRQEFSVWIVSPARIDGAVKLSTYDDLAALRVPNLSVSDWGMGDPTLEEKVFQLGPDSPVNQGVILRIPGRRLITYYVIQVLIPLMAIVFMAYAVFWVSPTVVRSASTTTSMASSLVDRMQKTS